MTPIAKKRGGKPAMATAAPEAVADSSLLSFADL